MTLPRDLCLLLRMLPSLGKAAHIQPIQTNPTPGTGSRAALDPLLGLTDRSYISYLPSEYPPDMTQLFYLSESFFLASSIFSLMDRSFILF